MMNEWKPFYGFKGLEQVKKSLEEIKEKVIQTKESLEKSKEEIVEFVKEQKNNE